MAPRRPTGLGAWSQRLEEQVGESAATIALGLGGRATGSCVRVWSRSTQAAKRACGIAAALGWGRAGGRAGGAIGVAFPAAGGGGRRFFSASPGLSEKLT